MPLNPAIQQALMKLRGMPSPDVSSVPASSAPMPGAGGLDQAYNAPMNPTLQSATPPPSPFAFNAGLESQAQGANAPISPAVQQIMKHLGLLNLLRNRSNQQMVDPTLQGAP
jgi:hypothetical protein